MTRSTDAYSTVPTRARRRSVPPAPRATWKKATRIYSPWRWAVLVPGIAVLGLLLQWKTPGVGMSGLAAPGGSADRASATDRGEPSRAANVRTMAGGPGLRLDQIPAWPAAGSVQVFTQDGQARRVQWCQRPQDESIPFPVQPQPEPLMAGYSPAMATTSPDVRCGVACGDPGSWAGWMASRPLPWQVFAQGEYIGPHRLEHVPEYRLRVDDLLEFVYRLTRLESSGPYELNVGDQVRVESLIDPKLDRDLVVQPDGTITLLMLGQIRAARRTVEELRADIEQRYEKYYKVPAITVTPLQVNTKLEDLRSAVDSRFGQGGQVQQARVTPEGTVQLPAIGSVPAQGLTLGELKREVDQRYAAVVDGIEVTPRLVARAPRFVYVLGEVRAPGRYVLEAPTTAMQALALAGGWNFGGNIRQIVVFRRTDDWRLMATRLDLRAALLGREPCPADEIWLRDSDIIMIPKSQLLLTDDWIDLLFTRGLYGVVPMNLSINLTKLTSI